MIPGYQYTGMMVTGVLHCLLSVGSVITSIVGLSTGRYFSIYFIVTLLVGLYFGVVGGLGIAAGLQSLEDNRTRNFKIAYMVTAILSACIFCLVAYGLYGRVVAITLLGILEDYYPIGAAGVAITVLEFILAIVSSSICCCCSSTIPHTTVIVQAPPQQIITTVPGNTTVQYQYPPNNTMQYTATGDGAVSHQPPNYQQYPYQTKP